jgi:thiol-disulfide isomerase/thioredoxin
MGKERRNKMLRSTAVALLPVAAPMLFVGQSSAQASNDKGRFAAANDAWLNSVPLSSASLLGKVVLVNFWTYSCINSLRALPYVKSWAEKYKNAGLVGVGVHTPEFSFEKERANVETAVRDLKVTYPVVMDSNYGIWHAFNNEYWPAFYLIEGKRSHRPEPEHR